MVEQGGKNENAIKYLKKLKRLDERVDKMLGELYAIKNSSIGSVGTKERVKTSPNNNQMVDLVAKIIKKEKEIDIAVDTYANYKETMLFQISCMENKRYAMFLKKRFVDYKTISELASESNMSISGMKKLQRKSVNDFAKKYNI